MTLDIFDAESSRAAGAGSVPAEIALSEVTARQAAAPWNEVVAVVEELCHLLTAGDGEARVPAAEDVLMSAQGQIRVVYGGRGEKGPAAAARLLHTALGETDIPIQLRLFISQATAPETHATIREFAAGLAYFGRPDRTELIRALYERCASRPAGSYRPAPPPLPKREPEQKAGAPARRRRLHAGWVAAAALLVAVAAGAWAWRTANPGGSAADAASQAADAVTGTLRDMSELAREMSGPVVRPAGAEAPDAPAPGAATASASASAPRPRVVTPASAVVPEVTLAGEAARAPGASTASNFAPATPVVQPDAGPAEVAAPAPAVVYSQDDDDVVPPALLLPQLPVPLVTLRSEDNNVMNRMEVLVAADGSVERVRLLAGPRRMPDMMLLSGAKTWRFEPALKDGVPVRYRTILSWTATP